jgi:hypothetical protein
MNKCFKSALINLLFIEQNMKAMFGIGLKILCNGYVIGSPILFDSHLIKEKQ